MEATLDRMTTVDRSIAPRAMAEFVALVEATEPVTAEQAQEWAKSTAKRSSGRNRDGRPEIIVGYDEARVVDEAIAALATQRTVYQRAGMLVQVVRDAEPPRGTKRQQEAPRIVAVRQARLRELLASGAVWQKPGDEEDEVKLCHPVDWAVRAVEARGEWRGIRRLEGVVEVPVLRTDGSILQAPGYDEATGLLFQPRQEFAEIPQRPTLADAERAKEALLEVVCDVCFAGDEYKSAWMASLLTPLARFAYHGPTPLFLIDANVPGCGKGLLVTITTTINSSKDVARMTVPDKDDEFRKRITSIAMSGEQIVLLDNVPETLGSPSLDAALTATSWSDRILGISEMANIPLFTVWYATGNNVIFRGDTSRRVLPIRLKSLEENPEERSGFTHPDLCEWVVRERGRLTAEALTILSAYCAAGRPSMNLKPWGSFEAWSDLVRQAVVWCRMPDPAQARREMISKTGDETSLLRRLLLGWHEADPEGLGMTIASALKLLAENPTQYEILRAAIAELTPPGKETSARSIGMKIHHSRQRVVGGRYFDKIDDKLGAVWSSKVVDDRGTRGTRGTSCALRGENSETGNCEEVHLGKKAPTMVDSPSSPSSPPEPCTHPAGEIEETETADGYVNRRCRKCGWDRFPCRKKAEQQADQGEQKCHTNGFSDTLP
jgi:hypothetical protein